MSGNICLRHRLLQPAIFAKVMGKLHAFPAFLDNPPPKPISVVHDYDGTSVDYCWPSGLSNLTMAVNDGGDGSWRLVQVMSLLI